MSAILDIKISNPLEKSAKATAKSMEDIARHEAKINALMKKGNVDAKFQKEVQKQFAMQRKGLMTQEAKLLVEGRKKTDEDKKQLGWVKSITREYLFVKDAAKLAFGTIKKLTVDLMTFGKDAFKNNELALYKFAQIAGGGDMRKGAAQMAEVDSVAHKIGLTLNEARGEYIKLLETTDNPLFAVTNKDAMRLLKLYADIKAVSQSSEHAQEELAKLQSFRESPPMFQKFEAQLRKTQKTVHGVVTNVGSGDIAAALAPKNVEAAAGRVTDALEGVGVKFWKSIGPAIGDAANKLANFIEKFTKSKEFAEVMNDVKAVFEWLATKGIKAVTDGIETLTKKWIEFKKAWVDIGTGMETQDLKNLGKEKLDDAKGFIDENFGRGLLRDMQKGFQQLFDTPPAQPIPAKPIPGKQGALIQKNGTQLAGITIEKIEVNGGGDAQEVARSIRQEMQLLLRAGALSRGAVV